MLGIEYIVVRYIQGPQLYSPNEVAAALGNALGRHVAVEVIRQEKWEHVIAPLGSPRLPPSLMSEW